ncbi:MAG: DUF1015 family protein [Planctomycetota bacterium]|nr:DUF1015 family protein [Planctomycetota bacterium]
MPEPTSEERDGSLVERQAEPLLTTQTTFPHFVLGFESASSMVTVLPIDRALVPVDSAAAEQLIARNYDEFQNDREVWDAISKQPNCVLKVTMPHCDVPTPNEFLQEGSVEALNHAVANLQGLVESDLTRLVGGALYVYEIESRSGHRQIGLGGHARTGEIRTDTNPHGTIVRNEGIRESKAKGRADLVQRTNSYIGVVNCAVEDASDALATALRQLAEAREPDYVAPDNVGDIHRTWILSDANEISRFQILLANEPCAYVADGNHRSAAAALLGNETFLAVFFVVKQLSIWPYNRLVGEVPTISDWAETLADSFTVESLGGIPEFQPTQSHEVGLYTGGVWYRLRPLPSTFDPANAVEAIDADIVQRHLFEDVFGITDARDPRLTFVGGDRDARYLKDRVDNGPHEFAVTLPPVTMQQFVDVCRQNRFMPPKSTWFEPKIRSGLVISLLDQS